MFKIVSIKRLAVLLTTIFLAGAMHRTEAWAQHAGHGGHAGGGGVSPGGQAAYHPTPPTYFAPPAGPVNNAPGLIQPTQQRGVAVEFPMNIAPRSSCSSCSMGSEQPKASMDLIQWPTLLQEPAFAPERGHIEAPYRRVPPGLSTPTASDYREMVKTVEEMKAILEWRTKTGVDTQNYQQAKDFLNKLALEARKRSEIAPIATPCNTQAVLASRQSRK